MTNMSVAAAAKLISPALALTLAGCAISFEPPQKFYDGPELPKAALAIVHVWDAWERSGDRVSFDWISRVEAVDGRATNGRWVALKPGSYTLTMSCQVNQNRYPGSAQRQPTPFKLTVRAGTHYYPWCKLAQTSVATTYIGNPGMPIAEERYTLSATPFMDTKGAP